jgi:hypothetical protein
MDSFTNLIYSLFMHVTVGVVRMGTENLETVWKGREKVFIQNVGWETFGKLRKENRKAVHVTNLNYIFGRKKWK